MPSPAQIASRVTTPIRVQLRASKAPKPTASTNQSGLLE